MFRWFQPTRKRRLMALDALRANVMVADSTLTIVYMNPAMRSFMARVEADLRKELPRFDMATMIGSNIDIFYKEPSHQRSLLAQIKQRHQATITIGAHKFDLLVTPLMHGQKHDGFVVEWGDASVRLLAIDYAGQIAALGRSQAMIEFNTDGTIVTANDVFLKVLGYTIDEVRGRPHSIFIDPKERDTQQYREFWDGLRRGEAATAEFRRLTKRGTYVTIQGSYNPILNESGQVTKVVKTCLDVTGRVRSVDSIAAALTGLANGDVEARIEEPLTGELDNLRVDFNRAAGKLQETMMAIAANADGVREGAKEITSASDDLSRRTEQQAASIEETAASLDQITATVRKTAEGAVEARGVVGTAKEDAQRTGAVVQEAVCAMQMIEASSQKIGTIIGVIDEIAFQTNLLALNAGVEAARAGDAGRGFAVVATEVRALAQRSADAAKEIKALISTSGDQVGSGVRLVGMAGEALTRIVGHVDQINGLVAEMASAAQEQATALGQVNTAVNQMDKVTQQNAAMVEQSTAASHSLAGEAEALMRLVRQFKTGTELADGTSHVVPARAPVAASHAAPALKPAAAPLALTRTPAAAPRPMQDRRPATALRETAPLAKRPIPALSEEENWSEF